MPLLDMKYSEDREVLYFGCKPPTHIPTYVARSLTAEERTIMTDYYQSKADKATVRYAARGRTSYIVLALAIIDISLALSAHVSGVTAVFCAVCALACLCLALALYRRKSRARKIMRLLNTCERDGVCYHWGDILDRGRDEKDPVEVLRNKDFGQRMSGIFYDRRVKLAKQLPDIEVGERPYGRPGLDYLLGDEECLKYNPVLIPQVDKLVSDYINSSKTQYHAAQKGRISDAIAAQVPHQIEIKAAETLRRIDVLIQEYGLNYPPSETDERAALEEFGHDIVERTTRDIADQKAQAWIDGVPFVDPPRP